MLAGQLAVTVLLLAGAGLFARSLARLTGPGKGFDTRGVLVVGDNYHELKGLTPAALERIRALPGVAAAGASGVLPVQGSSWSGTIAAGDEAKGESIFVNPVSPGFFAALRMGLLSGRGLEPADADRSVVILNATLARQLFPAGKAVGATVWLDSGKRVRREVIGVVEDAKYSSLRAPMPPTAYFPLSAKRLTEAYVEVRSLLPEAQAERQLRAFFPAGTPIVPYQAVMDEGLHPERLLAWIAGLFGGLALLLAAIGLYGVTAYNAGRRRREFAIRAALGARRGEISGQMLREAGMAVASGLALGTGLSWLAARGGSAVLGKLLYQTSAADAGVWLGAVTVMAGVGFFAAWLPARRAGAADPMAALREE
jgi:hypothetical protein